MLEKEIEKSVKAYAESKGWLTRKWVSPNHNFVPDQIFIMPGGKVIFVEFKALGKKPTPGQLREHARLEAQGCHVWVVDDVTKGKGVIDAYCV